MKIKSLSLIEGMSGKLDKDENIVFSNRYGNIHAWRHNAYRGPFTEKQIAQHNKFASVAALVAADMADPEKKAEWETVSRNSRGRWKTARGAAFAAYMAE